MKQLFRWALSLALLASLAACVVAPRPAHERGPHYRAAPVHSGYGRVHNIERVRVGQAPSTGTGAVAGAVVGGVVGRQFGNSGQGRAAGTAIGVIAGAIIGDKIERDQQAASGQEVWRVTVRMDSGELRAFDYLELYDLRIGDRVRIENNLLYRP